MTADEIVKQRIADLIEKSHGRYDSTTGDHSLLGWEAQALSFLRDFVGERSVYYQSFEAAGKETPRDYAYRKRVGIIQSLLEDVTKGYLSKYRSLVAAEIFADMIEMAEYFTTAPGYKTPAASVCGAALEVGLRQILVDAGFPAKESDRLKSLNQQCLDRQIYNKIRYEEIKSWTAIRDHADHGEIDEYDEGQVKRMIEGVRGLFSEHLR